MLGLGIGSGYLEQINKTIWNSVTIRCFRFSNVFLRIETVKAKPPQLGRKQRH